MVMEKNKYKLFRFIVLLWTCSVYSLCSASSKTSVSSELTIDISGVINTISVLNLNLQIAIAMDTSPLQYLDANIQLDGRPMGKLTREDSVYFDVLGRLNVDPLPLYRPFGDIGNPKQLSIKCLGDPIELPPEQKGNLLTYLKQGPPYSLQVEVDGLGENFTCHQFVQMIHGQGGQGPGPFASTEISLEKFDYHAERGSFVPGDYIGMMNDRSFLLHSLIYLGHYPHLFRPHSSGLYLSKIGVGPLLLTDIFNAHRIYRKAKKVCRMVWRK
jgi:hypothetical protein